MSTSAAHPDGRWIFDVLSVITIHDGDTVKVVADRGGGDWWVFWLRIASVYAPELSEPGGYESRAWLETFIRQLPPLAWGMVVVTHRRMTSENDIKSLDRWVGELFVSYGSDTQRDVGQLIIDAGHATRVKLGAEPW
jgi:endonuclease YncB( thermonuclease family)